LPRRGIFTDPTDIEHVRILSPLLPESGIHRVWVSPERRRPVQGQTRPRPPSGRLGVVFRIVVSRSHHPYRLRRWPRRADAPHSRAQMMAVRKEAWSAAQARSGRPDRAASASRPPRMRPTMAYLRFLAKPFAGHQARPRQQWSKPPASWNTSPKAKISVMIRPRYSDTFGKSWIEASVPAACPVPSTGRTTSPSE
jgi:hypothetical protein